MTARTPHPHMPSDAEHAPGACCGGHCANVAAPIQVERAQRERAVTGVQTPIRILQMDCPTEEALLRSALGSMAGVQGMEFNLMQRVLTVTHQPQALEPVMAAIRTLGFSPELVRGASAPDAPAQEAPTVWWPLAIAGLAAVASEVVHWAGLPSWAAVAFAVVAVLASGTGTFQKGWIAIRHAWTGK